MSHSDVQQDREKIIIEMDRIKRITRNHQGTAPPNMTAEELENEWQTYHNGKNWREKLANQHTEIKRQIRVESLRSKREDKHTPFMLAIVGLVLVLPNVVFATIAILTQ